MGAMIDEVDPNLHKIALFASRDIKKGQQLSFDYEGVINGPYALNDSKTVPRSRKSFISMQCFCGAKSCRKIIKL